MDYDGILNKFTNGILAKRLYHGGFDDPRDVVDVVVKRRDGKKCTWLPHRPV